VYELHAGATSSNASYVQVSGEVASTTIGSKGQCKILENDATHIKGLFYFETVAPVSGTVLNVSKGYFNVTK
jgi:hypothetical protein